MLPAICTQYTDLVTGVFGAILLMVKYISSFHMSLIHQSVAREALGS